MAQTLKFGNKTWATKVGSTLAYNDENGNYKPLPFAFTRSTSATRVNKQGLIEVVTNDRPRIDYTDTSDGVLLLEKAATNLIPYSESFENSFWSKFGTSFSVIDNDSISPSGYLNASKLNVSNTDNLLYGSISFSSTNAAWAFSIYAKGSGSFDMNIRLSGNVATTQTMTLTSDWQRFDVTSVNGTSITSVESFLDLNNIVNMDVFGAQLETGVASSYIPTQGSASTRVAETASDSGNSEVFNDSQGVLFANIAANSDDLTSRFITLSDSSVSNSITFFYSAVSNKIRSEIKSSGVTQSNISTIVNSIVSFNKVAAKYKENDFSLWVNGFKIGVDVSGVVPIGLSDLSFDRSGASDFYGKTKEIGYYDTILTDLELETLTSYKSWTSMVNELNLNIIYNG